MSSHHNSLRWRSGVNLVVIAAALVAITVITNAYSFNLMLRNFRQSLSSTAQIYTEQISGKVDKINSGSLELSRWPPAPRITIPAARWAAT